MGDCVVSYAGYQVAVAPPWLQDQWGAAWLGGHGATKDDYLQQFIQAVKAAFPELSPQDALAALGDEMGLDIGPTETYAAYAQRLRQAWVYWPLAGTPVGLLQALHFAGLDGAVLVQQNGRQYSFTTPYTPGADPTANLVVSDSSALITTLTSSVTPSRSIPAGTPWFFFDSNTDFCSRFAVIIPKWPFAALGVATFNDTDVATVTWPFAFGSAVYTAVAGLPSSPVILSTDDTSKTTTTVNILASGRWTGSVFVIGFAAGVSPVNLFPASSVGGLKNTIKKWKPAKATCMGVYAITSGGRTWDYFPPGTTWDGGTYPTWDTSTTSQILGVF